jgi:hypothetical protein
LTYTPEEIAAARAYYERAMPHQSKCILVADTESGNAISERGMVEIVLAALDAYPAAVAALRAWNLSWSGEAMRSLNAACADMSALLASPRSVRVQNDGE